MHIRLRMIVVIMLIFTFATPLRADFEGAYKAFRNRDHETALREFGALAEQGDARAQFYLGVMYQNGQGVTKESAEAAKWYLRSTEQGHPDAQQNLALLYRNGDGAAQDYIRAHMWYSLAAGQGSAFAGIQRDLLAASMTPEQLTEAGRMAGEWKAK